MECGVGQKEWRSRNSVTSWRGLFLPLPLLYLCPSLSTPLFIACFPSLRFLLSICPSLTCSLCQAAALWCGAGTGTLCLASFFILSVSSHTYNMAIFYNNTHWCMHKITNLKHKLLQAGMCGNLPLATSVTCIWSWWGAKKATDPGD